MLNEVQREQNYAYQKVANGGFNKVSSVPEEWQPTPAQARRLRKKANKAKGDHPRSRKARYLAKLRAAIENRRKLNEEIERRRVEREKATLGMTPLEGPEDITAGLDNELLEEWSEETPAGKSLCSKEGCEPQAPDWSCRTASGKKTKDHAGRVH
jgi:hypothetical protein